MDCRVEIPGFEMVASLAGPVPAGLHGVSAGERPTLSIRLPGSRLVSEAAASLASRSNQSEGKILVEPVLPLLCAYPGA